MNEYNMFLAGLARDQGVSTDVLTTSFLSLVLMEGKTVLPGGWLHEPTLKRITLGCNGLGWYYSIHLVSDGQMVLLPSGAEFICRPGQTIVALSRNGEEVTVECVDLYGRRSVTVVQ